MDTTTVLPEVTAVGVIIKAIMILAIISALAGFGTYIERKVLAFMHEKTWTSTCWTVWGSSDFSRWY